MTYIYCIALIAIVAWAIYKSFSTPKRSTTHPSMTYGTDDYTDDNIDDYIDTYDYTDTYDYIDTYDYTDTYDYIDTYDYTDIYDYTDDDIDTYTDT